MNKQCGLIEIHRRRETALVSSVSGCGFTPDQQSSLHFLSTSYTIVRSIPQHIPPLRSEAKYPKAARALFADMPQLPTHFDFPAAHWKPIWSTNLIESMFATVKLRTGVTKGRLIHCRADDGVQTGGRAEHVVRLDAHDLLYSSVQASSSRRISLWNEREDNQTGTREDRT